LANAMLPAAQWADLFTTTQEADNSWQLSGAPASLANAASVLADSIAIAVFPRFEEAWAALHLANVATEEGFARAAPSVCVASTMTGAQPHVAANLAVCCAAQHEPSFSGHLLRVQSFDWSLLPGKNDRWRPWHVQSSDGVDLDGLVVQINSWFVAK